MILLDQSSAHSRRLLLWLLLLFAIAYSYSVASFQIAKNNRRSHVRSRHPNNHCCSFRPRRRDYNGIVLLPSSATLVSVSSLSSGDSYNNNNNNSNNRKSTKLFDSKILALDEVEEGNEDDDENSNNNDNFVFIWEDSGFEYNDEYNFNEDDFDGYNDGEDVIVKRIVDDVAKRFQTEILSDSEDNSSKPGVANDMLERAAIYFVIFLSNDDNNNSDHERTTTTTSSFIDFLDWFNDLEDNWSEDCDDVIIAPFHPDWQFEFDTRDEYALNYEKRSPYPLISIVSTNVVEKAGEAVTELIGDNNREILLSIEKNEEQEGSEGSGGGGAVAKLWQSSIDS
ncbi:hypothetical protein FRACYDRAFT_244768 [Fragilariopsis cylindrus CCMP1102]|uniref:Uncharacterized protein n=1 Tax=Fragilariopsis cylindrus CCMP1102 TaxID=635003 RepID=A0A1E7F053_9STRA|nr:hypothetical protein FRACYDRAFT_244768 [Fragilariopsis cylindrus CCMP1102]|eukprot:OEU11650.1 hypothetical protein FRACYDRAFT_244768 [Fragilariopsis cylindrus CCMP1102]